MAWSSVLGFAALIAIIGFIVFAFRQGEKVKNPPEGTPSDSTGGYAAGHDAGHNGGGHSF